MISQLLEKQKKVWLIDDQPDLCLGPPQFHNESSNSLSSELEANSSRKRKNCWEAVQNSIELHLTDPLPVDWEQCLDLESGRMYYINRKTLKKSWSCPKNQKLDLELNMSPFCDSGESYQMHVDSNMAAGSTSNSNMVAIACSRCHLLVMLSESSPACPNCKYVHSLPAQKSPPSKVEATKTLKTLSLLR
ncbi:unnamed protein product [Victoria cruziana]